jgi:hypothetical protein
MLVGSMEDSYCCFNREKHRELVLIAYRCSRWLQISAAIWWTKLGGHRREGKKARENSRSFSQVINVSIVNFSLCPIDSIKVCR